MGAAQQRARPPAAKRRRREEPSPEASPESPPVEVQQSKEWAYFTKNTRKSFFGLQLVRPRNGVAHLATYLRASGIRGLRAEIDSVPVLIQLFEELASADPPVALAALSLTSYAPDGNETLNETLARFLRNCHALKYLKLQFKSNSEVVGVACRNLPPAVHTLDLSDGFLPADSAARHVAESFRVAIIRCPNLQDLNLCGSGVQAEPAGVSFYKCLEGLGPFASSLRDIRGISFKAVTSLPSRPPLFLCSRSGSSNFGWTVPRVLSYLHDRVFSQLFVERVMRVWWPPTEDPLKRDFAGRFWPAKILRVNPATLALLVRYDNGEQGYVSCREVFPDSLYHYGGGGARAAYLADRFSQEALNTAAATIKDSLVSRANWSLDEAKSSEGAEVGAKKMEVKPEISTTSQRQTRSRKESSNRRMEGAAVRGSVVKFDGASFVPFLPTVNDSANKPLRDAVIAALDTIAALQPTDATQADNPATPAADMSLALVEQLLFQLPEHKAGAVLFPGEMCEFREGKGLLGDGSAASITPDPSDFLVRVESVHEEEPMYTIRYIFHEDEDTLRVNSADIRRAVHTDWESWQTTIFRRLKRLPQVQQQYNIPPEHFEQRALDKRPLFERPLEKGRSKERNKEQPKERNKEQPKERKERRNLRARGLASQAAPAAVSSWTELLLSDSDFVHTGGNNAFYLPRSTREPSSAPTTAPTSLETTSVEAFAVWFLAQLRDRSHPALRPVPQRQQPAVLAPPRRSRRSSTTAAGAVPAAGVCQPGSDEVAALQSKLAFLAPFHQEALELREKFAEFSRQVEDLKRIVTCCICLDTPLATLLQPCGHLVACEKCSARVNCCPTCRARIRQRVRVTNFSIDVYDTLQKFIATESF